MFSSSTEAVKLPYRSASGAGLFRVVCVADRVAKPAVELGAVQDHFLRMHRIDRAQRDREVTGILDVDYQLGLAARRNRADGAELLASIGAALCEDYQPTCLPIVGRFEKRAGKYLCRFQQLSGERIGLIYFAVARVVLDRGANV